MRGKYWTIADESGKVVSRDIAIDETKYTELMPEFENTYFKEVYQTLRKKFKLGRVRLLLKEPRSTLSGTRILNRDYIFQLSRIKDVQWLLKI